MAAEASRDNQTPLGPASVLTALGVVFGDLGTSPLYVLQTVSDRLGGRLSADAALGVLSLIIWTLVLTISIKYCLLVMRADNHGEGGILALMSLVGANRLHGRAAVLTVLGLLGASLIYGDGTFTPAISVLSAIEGVNVVTDSLRPFLMPIAAVVLLALFLAQRFGASRIGGSFGPVILAWFVVLAALGIRGIAAHPGVLWAVNPAYAAHFLVNAGGGGGLLVLGGVFLCITGGEALYADIGHVGRASIRLSWYAIVLPALLLNYAGQTALLLSGQPAQGNPFFRLAPAWAIYPTVVLATAATIIASQAIITGVFSMTRQAMQLRWLPPMSLRQTSECVYGQIYVPVVNWLMMAATLGIVISFRSSDRLAGAYGTAVSTTMLITTILLTTAMLRVWRWNVAVSLALSAGFLAIDLAFFVANLLKIRQGGWLPLTLGAGMLTVMVIWRSGVDVLRGTAEKSHCTTDQLLQRLDEQEVVRPEGTAIFLTHAPRQVPRLVGDYVAFTGSLPKTVAIVSVEFEEAPRVDEAHRVDAEEVSPGLWCVAVRFGFVETPSLDAAMHSHESLAAALDLKQAVYYGARDLVVRKPGSRVLCGGRLALFAFLYRNALRVLDRFSLPPGRVLEIAREIEV
jgi:KUP system potassium uptake protein